MSLLPCWQANMRVHPYLFDWMLAMMVTFAEAYLESVLLLLAAAKPGLMATKEMVISGNDVLNIEVDLTAEERWQELMEMMRQRWTIQFLREKPTQWITRLQNFGARKYRAGLAEEMKTIWNRRHAIVQARPAAQSDIVVGVNVAASARVVQSKGEFTNAADVIHTFVTATDAFVVGLLRRSS
jgi:hypothetical protein